VLSTFLGQIQNYFSKYFIIGSFLPVLAFTALNGIVAYLLFSEWQRWVDVNLFGSTLGHGAFFTTSFVVGMLIAAYVLSALSTFLRQRLEGKGWGTLAAGFISAQDRRREILINELQEAAMEVIDLEDAPQWEQLMLDAQAIGRRDRRGQPCQIPNPDTIEDDIRRLEGKRGKYREIVEADQLRQIAESLAARLQKGDVDRSPDVERQQERLIRLIDYAGVRARARYARLQNELNSNFGVQELASTKMGNVANSIQSYAVRRYHCNFEPIWSNLQRLVQKDDKAQATLQEAKTQLDFLIACCWLSLLSASMWALVFGAIEPSRIGFSLAALGGPVAAYVWYRAAAEQYRSFAGVVMTSLDTFRLDLLRDMKLSTPTDVEEEPPSPCPRNCGPRCAGIK
jgi:hypothetical protein